MINYLHLQFVMITFASKGTRFDAITYIRKNMFTFIENSLFKFSSASIFLRILKNFTIKRVYFRCPLKKE